MQLYKVNDNACQMYLLGRSVIFESLTETNDKHDNLCDQMVWYHSVKTALSKTHFYNSTGDLLIITTTVKFSECIRGV